MREKKKKGERALTFELKRSLEKGLSEISENRSGWNAYTWACFFKREQKPVTFYLLFPPWATKLLGRQSTTFSILLLCIRSFSFPPLVSSSVVPLESEGERFDTLFNSQLETTTKSNSVLKSVSF